MTKAAADFRLLYRGIGFAAKSCDCNSTGKPEKGFLDPPAEDHILAGVRPNDRWHRAIGAQLCRPIISSGAIGNEPAFFTVPAAIVISEKIRAFNTLGCFHVDLLERDKNLSPRKGTRSFVDQLDALPASSKYPGGQS